MKWIIAVLLVANAAWGYLIPQTGELDVDGVTLVIGAEINKPDGEDPRKLIGSVLDADSGRSFEVREKIANAIKAAEISPELDDQEGRWKRAKDAVKDWEDRLALARAFKDELARHATTAAVYFSMDPAQYERMPDPFGAIQTLLDDFNDRVADIMATDPKLLEGVAASLMALRRNADQFPKGLNKDVEKCWGILIGEGKHPEWWDEDVKAVALAAEAKNPLRETKPAVATALPSPVKETPVSVPAPTPSTPVPTLEVDLEEAGILPPPEEKYNKETSPPVEENTTTVATEVTSSTEVVTTETSVTSPEVVATKTTEAPTEFVSVEELTEGVSESSEPPSAEYSVADFRRLDLSSKSAVVDVIAKKESWSDADYEIIFLSLGLNDDPNDEIAAKTWEVICARYRGSQTSEREVILAKVREFRNQNNRKFSSRRCDFLLKYLETLNKPFIKKPSPGRALLSC